ncbi:MAG: DUF3124 domain-containing protein [Spirulina sp.]
MPKANFLKGLLCCIFGLSVACTTQETSVSSSGSPPDRFLADSPGAILIAAEQLPSLVTGQVIYVPIYSEIYDFDRRRTFQLTATLSLRNTDKTHPIFIELVDYYNSGGEKISSYLNQPIQLNPLASTEVVVAKSDEAGGAGANFIVEWRAANRVSEPVIEAIMISTISQQGISFVSPGRVVRTRTNQ